MSLLVCSNQNVVIQLIHVHVYFSRLLSLLASLNSPLCSQPLSRLLRPLSTPLTPLSSAASVTRFTQTLLYCCLTEFDTETETGGKTQ